MGVRNQLSPHLLLAFFHTKVSNRVLRGGPKIFVYLAVGLFVSLLGVGSLSRRLSGETIGPVRLKSWYWTKGTAWATLQGISGDGKGKERDADNDAKGGGLRIVVFGGRDIATPELADQEGRNDKPGGWTEKLCHELRCSSYLSFVPTGSDGGRALESNGIYAEVLEQALNLTALYTDHDKDPCSPAEPLPRTPDVPDLKTQVKDFLSMEKPRIVARETLWVFTVGTWDIWSLAALPLDLSLPAVHKMTQDIFDQIERLYYSALDDKSIAWSTLQGTHPSNNSGVGAQDKIMFRILIPMVLDPTMSPMWTTDRPLSRSAHAEVEQLRNAFILAGEWNTNLYYKMHAWVMGLDDELGLQQPKGWPYWDMGEGVPDGEYFVDAIQRLQVEADGAARERKEKTIAQEYHEKDRRARGSEGPLRDGFLFNLPEYVLGTMAERQMRNAKLEDGNGLGGKPADQTYLDVSTPCTNSTDMDNDWPSSVCNAKGYLFSTPSTLASRAISDIGSLAAEMVGYNLSMRNV